MAVVTFGGTAVVPWADAATSSGERAIFEPLVPARILATRVSASPLTANEQRPLQVAGAGGVPADATGVVLNVTAFAPTNSGWLTLFPADGPLPLASNVNFLPGQTVPNAATVRLGATGADAGRIKIHNAFGTTHVIIDVAGYYRTRSRRPLLRQGADPGPRGGEQPDVPCWFVPVDGGGRRHADVRRRPHRPRGSRRTGRSQGRDRG